MHVLSASNLEKSYRGKKVVKDVSIHVASGEVLGLLGPNGAGKTTCFYIIVGLISHDQGEIKIDQKDISRMKMHERAKKGICYLPQEPSVFRNLTVEQNLLAILETREDLSKKNQTEKATQLMEEFRINHIKDTLGVSLSGGERRRVEIARALTTEPNFILLDEPFAGVDPISVGDIKKIVFQLSEKGIGVLITDHNVRETLDICEKAYIVNEGSIIAKGTPEQVLGDKQVQAVYLGQNYRM